MKRSAALTRFSRSESGTVAILWSVSLVVFIGFLALVVDIGRVGVTQSELQAFADHVALTAAAELDGKTDAITRANGAAANLISDSQTFATGARALSGTGDYALTFYSAIPNDDRAPLTAITTDPREARFARVVVTTRSVTMDLAAALEGLVTGTYDGYTANVNAEAVAGYKQAACDITPLMACLPTDWETTLNIGDHILLRSGGNGTAWGPGNFGFIDLDLFDDDDGVCADQGGNRLACLLAAQEAITGCVNTNGTIDTEPGQKVGITNAAFNTRFDIYRATLNGKRNNPIYSPAPNVVKGVMANGGGQCIQGNEQPTGDTMALPRDGCLATSSCGTATPDRFGDGVWDRQGYLDMNHDLADGIADGSGSDTHLPVLAGADAQYAGTRYGMYLREIAYGNGNPHGQGGQGPYDILDPVLSESGRPQCSNQMSNNPARRVVMVAGVDCVANPVQGSTTGVPVERYMQVFLTEPVGDDGGSPPSFDIHGEFMGFADVPGGGVNGSGGIFRDVVQLYR